MNGPVPMQPEIIDVSHAEAPASLSPVSTRDSLLKPPDWRYQAAVVYLDDERNGDMPTIPSDPVVQYLIRGLRGLKGHSMVCRHSGSYPTRERYLQKCWPVLYETLAYGLLRRRSAVAAMLDSCLIKGWSHEEATMAGCPVGKKVYDLYSKAFFDLAGIRAVHCWIQDFLFEPERYSENPSLLRARMLAYFTDGTGGTAASVSGMLTDGESAIIKKLISNERQKKLFDYVVQRTKLPPDVYASIMETALKGMSEHDFQERMRDRDDVGSSSLEELAAHMEDGIRAYSQHELQNYDGSGLDFVNQYTRTLTGNTDNGKQDIGK